MTALPLVCVVIPARNAEKTINETLASVCRCRGVTQIVVVDDASTDGTRMIALNTGDPRVEIVDGPGTGISGALNAGFAAVRATFVMRCDADDTVPADRLEWQLPLLENDPDIVAVSAGFETMLDDGTPCGNLACAGENRDVTEILKSGQTVTSLCTWLVRTETLRSIGGARDWFRTAEDVDLQYRLAIAGRVLHVPRVAYRYRLHDTSIVHSTSDSARAFFDDHAAEFALDRVKTDSDALDRGDPLPEWPAPERGRKCPAINQGINHAIATAWAEVAHDRHHAALKRISRLLKKAPAHRGLWKTFAKISLLGLAHVAGVRRKNSS